MYIYIYIYILCRGASCQQQRRRGGRTFVVAGFVSFVCFVCCYCLRCLYVVNLLLIYMLIISGFVSCVLYVYVFICGICFYVFVFVRPDAESLPDVADCCSSVPSFRLTAILPVVSTLYIYIYIYIHTCNVYIYIYIYIHIYIYIYIYNIRELGLRFESLFYRFG